MLKVDDATVNIGAFKILRGLRLEVPDGRIIGLVGRNGAGKTTTMRSIMGVLPLAEGRILLDDRNVTHVPTHERAKLGIGYLPEDRRLIGSLTVEENLLVPAEAMNLDAPRQLLETIYALLPEVQKFANRRALDLSGGQQKFVALGRSFVAGHRLLLLDEPFEGISTALSRRLAEVIRAFQETVSGLAVLVAESDLKRVAMLTDLAYVIERGEIIEEMRMNGQA